MKAVNKILFKVSKEFSKTPGPRLPVEGEFSGELFRERHLMPAIKEAINKNASLIIDLDCTAGYGTSFLEEAFGGLIRIDNYRLEELMDHLEFVSNEEPYLIEDIIEYLKDAENEAR